MDLLAGVDGEVALVGVPRTFYSLALGMLGRVDADTCICQYHGSPAKRSERGAKMGEHGMLLC